MILSKLDGFPVFVIELGKKNSKIRIRGAKERRTRYLKTRTFANMLRKDNRHYSEIKRCTRFVHLLALTEKEPNTLGVGETLAT